jgi:hypothetical protein
VDGVDLFTQCAEEDHIVTIFPARLQRLVSPQHPRPIHSQTASGTNREVFDLAESDEKFNN